MTTETDIANLALDVLKEAPITSLDDQRPIGKWLKRNFFITRDGLLAEAEWNSCLKRQAIPADSEAPAFGWQKSYTLPPDCIRLLPLTYGGEMEGAPIPHAVEGGKVYTNAGSPLKIRFIYRNENYSSWAAPLVETFAMRLAMKMAHWMTGKANYFQIARELSQEAFQRAWLTDAIEGTAPRAADQQYTEARY